MCSHNMSTTCACRLRCCDASCASPSGWFGYVCGMLIYMQNHLVGLIHLSIEMLAHKIIWLV